MTARSTIDGSRSRLREWQPASKGAAADGSSNTSSNWAFSSEVAAAAVTEVFAEVNESALLDRAISRRLKETPISALDARARARLIRQLITQGFEPAAVFARLRRKGLDPDE